MVRQSYTLDAKTLKRVARATKKAEQPEKTAVLPRRQLATEWGLFGKPAADIGPIDGSTPGSGTVTLWRSDGAGDIAATTLTVDVWNLCGSTLEANSLVRLLWHPQSDKWLAIPCALDAAALTKVVSKVTSSGGTTFTANPGEWHDVITETGNGIVKLPADPAANQSVGVTHIGGDNACTLDLNGTTIQHQAEETDYDLEVGETLLLRWMDGGTTAESTWNIITDTRKVCRAWQMQLSAGANEITTSAAATDIKFDSNTAVVPWVDKVDLDGNGVWTVTELYVSGSCWVSFFVGVEVGTPTAVNAFAIIPRINDDPIDSAGRADIDGEVLGSLPNASGVQTTAAGRILLENVAVGDEFVLRLDPTTGGDTLNTMEEKCWVAFEPCGDAVLKDSLSNDLIAWWPMEGPSVIVAGIDPGAGKWADISRNGRHLTDNGTASTTAGTISSAHRAQSNADKATLADEAAIRGGQSHSVSLWLRTSDVSAASFEPLRKLGCPGVNVDSSNERVTVNIPTDTGQITLTSANNSIADNTWYHVVYTWDESTNTGKLYLNSSLVDTDATGGNGTSGTSELEINRGDSAITTDVDEVARWNRVLSDGTVDSDENEIADLYNSGRACRPKNIGVSAP